MEHDLHISKPTCTVYRLCVHHGCTAARCRHRPQSLCSWFQSRIMNRVFSRRRGDHQQMVLVLWERGEREERWPRGRCWRKHRPHFAEMTPYIRSQLETLETTQLRVYSTQFTVTSANTKQATVLVTSCRKRRYHTCPLAGTFLLHVEPSADTWPTLIS
jgi:hypothetical protein